MDFITYWAGTKFYSISGVKIEGPKCENCRNEYSNTILLMLQNKDKLINLESLKIKEIEALIFRKEKIKPRYIGIYDGKSTKHISLNFKAATGILKTAIRMNLQNRSCIYCRERIETIYHIFLECGKLSDLRDDVKKMVRNLREDQQNLSWDYIINMNNYKHSMEYTVISIYKQIVWNNSTKIRWDGDILNQRKYRVELEKEVDFFIRHIQPPNRLPLL